MFEPIVEREIASAEAWMTRAEEYLDKEMLAAATKCLKFTCAHLLRAVKIVQLEKAPVSGGPTPVHHQLHWYN